jgi:uncharacterized protein YxeA
MKKILISIVGLLLITFIASCSRNPEPQVRIRNDQPGPVTVKIQASGDNSTTNTDVEAGQTTAYQSVAEGNITSTSITQNESVSFRAAKNTHYTIIISAGQSPTLHIDK